MPVIPAISDDVPINTRRVLLAMKTTIEYLLQQTGTTTSRTGGTVATGGTTGSSLHNALGGLQGGSTNNYHHLTSAQVSDLTDGADSAAHYHPSDRDLSNATGLLPFSQVDTTGVDLGDFGSLAHVDLTGLQGGSAGQQFHLTAEQWAFLLQGTDTVLHYHDSDRARANHTGTQAAATISDQMGFAGLLAFAAAHG